MDWSKYSSLKSSKLASLGKEKQVTKEAVSEAVSYTHLTLPTKRIV